MAARRWPLPHSLCSHACPQTHMYSETKLQRKKGRRGERKRRTEKETMSLRKKGMGLGKRKDFSTVP